MPVILQTRLPDAQTGTPGLPGTGPCGAEDWLLMDEAYAPQMVYREALLAERPEAVFYQSEAARPAAALAPPAAPTLADDTLQLHLLLSETLEGMTGDETTDMLVTLGV